jgi:hypothetical protein
VYFDLECSLVFESKPPEKLSLVRSLVFTAATLLLFFAAEAVMRNKRAVGVI